MVNHILLFRKENGITDEEITLIGYSHGGNVSVQAAKMLNKQYGITVNLITINTPAQNDNGPEDSDSPSGVTSIYSMIEIVTSGDNVAGGISFGSDKYTDRKRTTQTLTIDQLNEEGGLFNNHFIENVDPEQIIDALIEGVIKRLFPIQYRPQRNPESENKNEPVENSSSSSNNKK